MIVRFLKLFAFTLGIAFFLLGGIACLIFAAIGVHPFITAPIGVATIAAFIALYVMGMSGDFTGKHQ